MVDGPDHRWLGLALLVACAGQSPPTSGAPKPPGPAPKAPAAPATTLAHGTLVPGDAGWTFTTAGSDSRVPVPAEVAEVATKLGGAEDQEVYGQVVRAADGSVTGWRCVSLEATPCVPRTGSAPLSFHGTEPFWGIQVTENTATYADPEHPDPMRFTVSAEGPHGPWTLTPEAGGPPWTLTATPGACSDGMADVWYTFSITVTRPSGIPLLGCALDQRPPASAG